ncbi:MAG: amino acid-binding protein [Bacteroidales bacterium]|jgi:hypothetical protein|nr:amino acid-binding protein [Bacteroidales bacterium]
MIIPQLSVFLENKSGRLTEVLEVLGKGSIRIIALSIADTSEFGILRLIVPEPDKAKALLKEQLFTVNISEVISVKTPNEAKYYAGLLRILSDLDISVEYTYAFAHGSDAVIVLRCSNNDEAVKALRENKIELLSSKELYGLR